MLFFRGIALRDYPKLLRIRLTVCCESGHRKLIEEDYCINCGAPWVRSR